MSKEVVFTMKIERDLRADFMAEAAGEDRSASQVVRELMRGYIEQRRNIREYDEYLRRKVETGRLSMRFGRGRSNEEVETTFVAKRNSVKTSQS